MIIDIALGILSCILCIGFYTGNLDWVLIYYGCAPKAKKDSVDGEAILRIAYISTGIIAITMFIAAFMNYMTFYFVDDLLRIFSFIVFLVMLVLTFYLAQIKGTNKLRKLREGLTKTNNSSNLENNTVVNAVVKSENKPKTNNSKPKSSKKKPSKQVNTKSKNQRIQEALKGRR